ncbi:MAG: valine--tRNA ligase, partial [Candidatus Margulisiibacteriota bacterium]
IKEKPEQSATGVVSDIQFFVPLKGLIDINKEIERLKKENTKVEQGLERLIKLLANKDFVAKAPPETIAKQKAAQKELSDKKKIISARIKDLTV